MREGNIMVREGGRADRRKKEREELWKGRMSFLKKGRREN